MNKLRSEVDKVKFDGAGKIRIAALISHPIQYVVPLLQRLAARPEVALKVFFMTRTGLQPKMIEGYGETIQWDIPLLDGYDHEFLPNLSMRPDNVRPWAKVNPRIVRELFAGRYDALLMHGYSSVTEWMAFAAAKALGIPVLFWGDVLIGLPLSRRTSRLFRHVARKGFAATVDAALAMSSQAVRFYEKYGVPAERRFWVPLCVDNQSWISSVDALRPSRKELKQAIGADPDLPAIAYVAHMRPNKRPMDAILALEKMTVKASLIMAGAGPLFEEVKATVGARRIPRVHLLGAQNQKELPRLYAMSDVFVLPSSPGEVTPLVIHEAMCSSLPLIISDAVPSIIDFLREGENGHVYPVGSVDDLARRLDDVLVDERRAREMGLKSREMIGAWNYECAVDGVMSALKAVVGSRDSRERSAS